MIVDDGHIVVLTKENNDATLTINKGVTIDANDGSSIKIEAISGKTSSMIVGEDVNIKASYTNIFIHSKDNSNVNLNAGGNITIEAEKFINHLRWHLQGIRFIL